MCAEASHSKCGYLQEAYCNSDNQWEIKDIGAPDCLNNNCQTTQACPLSEYFYFLRPIAPLACEVSRVFPGGVCHFFIQIF